MSKLVESAFRFMEFNPVYNSNILMQDKYIYFKKKKIFNEETEDLTRRDLSDILKYILIFADRKSPLWDEKDFETRHMEAMYWSEVKSTAAIKEIEGKGEVYLSMLHEYFKGTAGHIYQQWISQKIAYDDLCSILRTPSVEASFINTKRALFQQIDSFRVDLMKVEAELFPTEELTALLAKAAMSESLGGWAEKYAKKIEGFK